MSKWHSTSIAVDNAAACLPAASLLFLTAWPFSLRPRFGAMSGRSGPPPMKFGNPGERLRKKRWNLDELPKFEKNFYTEHPEVQHMSQVIFCLFLCPKVNHKTYMKLTDGGHHQFCCCRQYTNQQMPRRHKSSNHNATQSFSQTCTFSVAPPLLLVRPVWGGRIPQEEGDHFERLRLFQGNYRFSPGAFSSWVNHTLHKPKYLHKQSAKH